MSADALLTAAELGDARAPRKAPRAEEAAYDATLVAALPVELVCRVLCLLPPNEVACVCRLVCKAAAAHFSGPQHTTVRLSQPLPHHAFPRHWGGPLAMRPLTLKHRRQLLCLTAASGDIDNLKLAALRVGCLFGATGAPIGGPAAAGPPEDECGWVRDPDCPVDVVEKVFEAAARAGRRPVVEWLLANGCPCSLAGAYRAAEGGHVGLMDWLLARCPPADPGTLLPAAAQGCDLPTLRRLLHAYLGRRLLDHRLQSRIVTAAAASPTPDWRAKLEWLERRGDPRTDRAVSGGARCSDAPERLAWLRARGYHLNPNAVTDAAGSGNAAALQYLLAEGFPTNQGDFEAAARSGSLAALQLLHAHGGAVTAGVVKEAARAGNLPAVSWLLERLGAEQRQAALDAALLTVAAASGSRTLLQRLRELGCPWGEDTFEQAVSAGCDELLEWLAEQGCPMGIGGQAYLSAGLNGDLATLECLRRLACPWDASTLTAAAQEYATYYFPRMRPAVLLWLLEQGCPVDWGATFAIPVPLAAGWAGPGAGEEPDGVGTLMNVVRSCPELQAWWEQHREG